MKILVGCFMDPYDQCLGHLRCARARQGNWSCPGCGHQLMEDGLCDRCDEVHLVHPDGTPASFEDLIEALWRHGCEPEPYAGPKIVKDA
jgi:hypothetical protein